MNRRSFITSILGILAIGPAAKAGVPDYVIGVGDFAFSTDRTVGHLLASRPYVKTLHPNEWRGITQACILPTDAADSDDFHVYYTYTTP